MKINYRFVLPPILFILFCAGCILLAQMLSDKPLSSEDIHEQSQELASYTRESSLLLTQYQKNHITILYLTEQLQQIQKQILAVSDDLSSAQLKTEDEKKVSLLLGITEHYSRLIRSITRSPQDKKILTQSEAELEKETAQIDSITKSYE